MDVRLIEGGSHTDARGIVTFFNDFNVSEADRFYTVRSHRIHQIRGWIGHRREHKWFTALAGSLIVAVVTPDNWDAPSRNLEVKEFTLSSIEPAMLHVPPGHATASIMLTPDAHLGVFSSGKIEDAGSDDYRFDAGMWKISGLKNHSSVC
jgi:hypothetical protein